MRFVVPTSPFLKGLVMCITHLKKRIFLSSLLVPALMIIVAALWSHLAAQSVICRTFFVFQVLLTLAVMVMFPDSIILAPDLTDAEYARHKYPRALGWSLLISIVVTIGLATRAPVQQMGFLHAFVVLIVFSLTMLFLVKLS